MTELTKEERYKQGNGQPSINGYWRRNRFYPATVLIPTYDLLIPQHRKCWQSDLLDRMESAHKKSDRLELVEELRWLLDTEFPPAPPEETEEVVG